MSTVINAFHPDYMKTYHPDFTKEFRTVEANQKERLENPVKVKRKFVPKKKKVSYKIPKQSKPQAVKPKGTALEALKKRILEAKPYHTFSKAGMPKGVH
jgi:hypothetical protein